MSEPLLRIDGEVDNPREFTFEQLSSIDAEQQIGDARELGAKREGVAIKLSALLDLCQARDGADYIGLHSSLDNFHASIPLQPIRDRAILIYRQQDEPLETKAGGPTRFFIPGHAACHTAEVDECANVKFLEHIELTIGKGFDNRRQDDEEHEALHREQE